MHSLQLSSGCQGNEAYFTANLQQLFKAYFTRTKKYTQVLVVLNGLQDDGWVGMLLGAFIFKAPQAILCWNWPQDNPIILKDYLSPALYMNVLS